MEKANVTTDIGSITPGDPLISEFGMSGIQVGLFLWATLGMKGTDKEASKPAWELYDLKEDPKELNNIVDKPENAGIVVKMKNAILEERIKYRDLESRLSDNARYFSRRL